MSIFSALKSYRSFVLCILFALIAFFVEKNVYVPVNQKKEFKNAQNVLLEK